MKNLTMLGSLLVAATVLAILPVTAAAQQAGSDPDAKCLKCHSKKLKKTLEDGETMFLQISADEFGESVHQVIGCTGCHRDVAKGKHPARQPIASRRDYSLERNEACSQCHAAKFKAYEGSVHAKLVAEGNAEAPVCTDCHGSHSIQRQAVYEPVSGEPCSNCHEAIYQAYADSVHGQARQNGNVIRDAHVQAPICADCHHAHEVSAVAANDYLRETCLDCHDGAAVAHEQWLPNAGMHLKSVSCAACHSPMAERRVDLQLYNKVTQVPVGQDDDAKAYSDRVGEVDPAGEGLTPVDLWKLVRTSNQEGNTTDVTLRGRMEVSTGVEAHRLAPRTEAVRSCESCHTGGADAFQNVTVSISGPDGRKQRFTADRKVLNSVVSVDSVGDFYAPGGTRIKLLDGLLALALMGGVAVPAGHIALGRYLRKKSRKDSK
jgi:mono/diheme cytochrome c family protein